MLSAFRYQKPKLILFHTDCEPEGEYWNALKHVLGDTLKIVKRSPPEKVWGFNIAVVWLRFFFLNDKGTLSYFDSLLYFGLAV